MPTGRAAATKPKPCVVVVDDSADSREMLTGYLAFQGLSVLEAADGESAIELARQHHPALILMDLQMPNVDGWEATRRLKADSATRDIIVVAITAQTVPPDAACGRRLLISVRRCLEKKKCMHQHHRRGKSLRCRRRRCWLGDEHLIEKIAATGTSKSWGWRTPSPHQARPRFRQSFLSSTALNVGSVWRPRLFRRSSRSCLVH